MKRLLGMCKWWNVLNLQRRCISISVLIITILSHKLYKYSKVLYICETTLLLLYIHLRDIKRIVDDHLNTRVYQYIFFFFFLLFFIYFYRFTTIIFLSCMIEVKMEIKENRVDGPSFFFFFSFQIVKTRGKKMTLKRKILNYPSFP